MQERCSEWCVMCGSVGAMAPKRKWHFSIISKDIGGTTNPITAHIEYQYALHLLAIHALLKWIYSILKYMEYSSYWRGWMKSSQIFYFCFAAPSLLARLRYGHKMVGSCREILLQKISKVQSGWTSGMICSHNGKIGLVGNVRIATGRRRRGRSRNKRQRPNWRLPILKRCYPLWPKMHKKTLLNQWNQTSMPRNERKWGRISFSCRRNVCIPVRDIAVQQCRRETKMVLLLVVQSLNEQLVTVASLRVPRQSRKTLSTLTFKNTQKTEFEDILSDTFA